MIDNNKLAFNVAHGNVVMVHLFGLPVILCEDGPKQVISLVRFSPLDWNETSGQLKIRISQGIIVTSFRGCINLLRIFLQHVPKYIEISLKIVPEGPINNILAQVQVIAWRRPGDKPLSKPM